MRARGYLGIVVFFFLVLIAPSVLVNAVEYGGLGGVPANPDPNNPRTKSIFVYTIAQGKTKKDAVNVVNNTAETKTVEVYATDSEIASGGSFACRQKLEPQNMVGGWVRLDQTIIQLDPNTSRIVPFEVKVPDDANVGEHNGCIVIQEKGAAPTEGGNGVQLSFRSALRVAITVPGDIVKDVQFTDLNIKGESKKYIINAQLKNKGNVSLDTDVQVSVKNMFNRSIYRNGGVYPLLAQKNPMELNFEFKRPFWGGWYRVSGTAAYNGNPKIALGEVGEKNVVKQAPGKLLFIAPQPAAAAIELAGLLLLMLLLWLALRQVRHKKAISRHWEAFVVDKGDTLNSLAREHRIDWKTIARANKLKAPYELKPGNKIKLPLSTKKR